MRRVSNGFAARVGWRWSLMLPDSGAAPRGDFDCWKTCTPIGNVGSVVGRIESR
jgi:hypothetical protein